MFHVPRFQIFNAPHELLSQHNFRQGSFINTYSLISHGHSFIAIASKHELTIAKFKTKKPYFSKPKIDDDISKTTAQSPPLPDRIDFSFFSMEHDRLFSMTPFEPNVKFTDIYFVRNGNNIILGVAYPDKAYCICVAKDTLIPFPELQPLNRLTCQPPPLGLN